MPEELPPNKVCRKCGAENLATASRCLECAAPLHDVLVPREEVLRIDGKSGLSLPPRGGFPWRGFFRVMAVPGCTLLAYTFSPTQEGRGLVGLVVFVAVASLTVVVSLATASAKQEGRSPREGWAIVEGFLTGVGCLFVAMAALTISATACFLAICYCQARQ